MRIDPSSEQVTKYRLKVLFKIQEKYFDYL